MTINSLGLLIDGTEIQEWQRRALECLISQRDVTIDLIISNKEIKKNNNSIPDLTLWDIYRTVHRHLLPEPSFRRQVPMNEVETAANATWIPCRPKSKDGIGNTLPENVVDELKSVDLGIRFGFGILAGQALNAPEYGVISFHHGDLQYYRGRPAGFWEFVDGRRKSAVTVQRLTETLDGGEIIVSEEVDIQNVRSWPAVQERLFLASDNLLLEAVDRLNDPGFVPKTPDKLGDIYSNPGVIGVVIYLIRWFEEQMRW